MENNRFLNDNLKYQIYVILNDNSFEWRLTCNLEVDLTYWHDRGIKELYVVEYNLPIGQAIEITECLSVDQKRLFKRLFNTKTTENKLKTCLTHYGIDQDSLKKIYTKPNFSSFLYDYLNLKHKIADAFLGKILLLEEIINFLNGNNLSFANNQKELLHFLQVGYLLEEIEINSGVKYSDKNEQLYCNRCGSSEKIAIRECRKCNHRCATCEECIESGRSKTCTPLLTFPYNNQLLGKIHTNYSNPSTNQLLEQLTPHQKEVALHVQNSVKNNKSILVWAVTGAGKTEIIYPLIEQAAEAATTILFASPRRDVIKELSPRFKKAFPNLKIITLFGGSEEKWSNGDLYLATTHQALRFNNYFDLVIIDEIDAFPFHNQPLLQFAVKRALKNNGNTVFLTATPSEDWLEKVSANTIDLALLPLRYHQKPLPTPEIIFTPSKDKLLNSIKPFEEINRFIQLVKLNGGQGLIFVSDIASVKLWTTKLKKWFAEESIEGVFANDNNRDQKIEEFKTGVIRFIVTTTIMERGITIPNVHVLVLNANARIFDSSTLIQIAGRVGRSSSYPEGLVWFMADYITADMKSAITNINKMNKKARKLLES